MKKVLFITYYWPPSGGAGVQRGLKFVKYLPEFGVAPTVLTVDPERASYPGLDTSLLSEVPDDVEVIRTDSFEPLRMLAAIAGKSAVPHAGFAGSDNSSLFQRIMRWVRGNWMIPDARRGWVKHAVKAATEVIERERIGTIVISSPPHSSQLIGLALKERFPQLRWVADLRDPWTDIYYTKELMKGTRAHRLDAAWEARVMRTADAIVVTTPSTRALFARRYGPEVAQRIAVIPNGYDRVDIDRVGIPVLSTDAFRITYVGTMAGSYAPRAFFAAIAALRRAGEKPIELRFVGSVGPEVRDIAVSEGVDDRCTWVPPVAHDEALREMAAAHMLFLVVPSVEGAERIIPGKVFEYIAMGRPIIGLGPMHSDVGAIIDECAAGRMFERNDAGAIAAWIAQWMREGTALPDNGKRSAYERKTLTGKLAEVIVHGAR